MRFHNGKVLTSADVLYSFKRVLDPKVNSKRREILAGVKGAEAFERGRAAEVEGILGSRSKDFRDRSGQAHALLPAAAGDACRLHRAAGGLRRPAEGLPFAAGGMRSVQVARWERSNFMELEAFGDYYQGRPKLDQVLVRFIENPASAMEEYRRGGLDYMDEMVGSETSIARELPPGLSEAPLLGTFYFGFNLARAPFKGNPNLRKAFNYAVDRQSLCDQTFEGTLTPSHGILAPDPGFNPQLRRYDFDPALARDTWPRQATRPGRDFRPSISGSTTIRSSWRRPRKSRRI